MNLPNKEKFINFKSELGSNGQFDDMAYHWFLEDNPGYEYHVDDVAFAIYCDALQENYDNKNINIKMEITTIPINIINFDVKNKETWPKFDSPIIYLGSDDIWRQRRFRAYSPEVVWVGMKKYFYVSNLER